jgi:sucrose-6-phosphate hydrolase SacC (GH32 family)
VYRTELIPGRVLYWDRPGGGEDYWEGTDYATRNGWHVLAAQIPGYAPVVSIYDRADGRNWRCTSATIAPR